MRVLVTGSAGFVGSRLLRVLRAQGHEVIGIDKRDPASTLDSSSKSSSQVWRADLHALRPGCLPPIDVCVHLASDVGGFLHNADRADLAAREIALVDVVSRLCRASGCRRLIYASSIAVFEANGEFESTPLRHFDQRTPYARGKASAEALVARDFDSFTIVRPTNIFGRDQPRASARAGESHVIPDLLHKIRAADDCLEVFGDGKQIRNFIHVDDVVCFLSSSICATGHAWVNLRSDIRMTIGALATELLRLSGRDLPIVYRPDYQRYEPHPVTPFDLAAARALHWRARVTTLADGLRTRPRRSAAPNQDPANPTR